jgi:hypothetical protein
MSDPALEDPDHPAVAAAVDAAARLVNLPVAPAHRAGVLRYFALAAGMARVVNAVPVAPADETGAVFQPVEPGDEPA